MDGWAVGGFSSTVWKERCPCWHPAFGAVTLSLDLVASLVLCFRWSFTTWGCVASNLLYPVSWLRLKPQLPQPQNWNCRSVPPRSGLLGWTVSFRAMEEQLFESRLWKSGKLSQSWKEKWDRTQEKLFIFCNKSPSPNYTNTAINMNKQ